MASLRRSLAVSTLRKKTQGDHCCVDNGYINFLPSTGSSVSSDDEFANRVLYSEVRRRMKSGSDSSSSDDDFTFEEIHYGNILSRRTRRRRLRGKFCSPRKYCSSLSSPSSMSSSSTPEKTKNIGPAIYYDYYDNTEHTEPPPTVPSRATTVPENLEPNKGQVKLVICGSSQKITVTLIEMQLPAYHPSSSQMYLKIHLIPDDNSSSPARFRTKILQAKVDSATVFHETFTFDLEPSCIAKRILISAWARNPNHGQRPFFLGCMSFGLRKLIENEEIVQGSYYLLSETLGRKKHLAAKSITDKRRSMNLNTHHKEPSQFHRNTIKRSTYTTRRDAIYYKNINIDLSNERNPGFVLCQQSPEIVSVCNHSAAFLAGLHVGDLIVKVNQQLVRSIGQDVLCSIIRNCGGTLQLLIRRTKESSSLYAPVPQHSDKYNRKRRSQHFSEENLTTKRRRSQRTNSNPSSFYSTDENNGDYAQYEDDDVFVSENSSESWKNSQINETKRNPAIYYDLNTTPSFVEPVEIKAVQTKAARILTQKVAKKTTQKPLHASKLNTAEDYPSYYTDNEQTYQRTNTSKPIAKCDKTTTPAIYYDITQPLPTVDEQSMSSDSGISEDNYTSLRRNTPQDSNNLKTSSAKQNLTTSKKENKLKFLSRVYSRDFRKPNYKKNNKVNLSQVLQSRKAILSFRSFLQKEHSEENLDFWLECESFKSLKQRKQEKQAVKIFKKYLETGAAHEVNITAEIRSTVAGKLSNPPNNIFNEAQRHIHCLMENDSFGRYLESQN